MRQHNILSKKVTLAEDVQAGQVISFSGHLATTGEQGKEPAGVSFYHGKQGEIIAIMLIGLIDMDTANPLQLGDKVKANHGLIEKADDPSQAFATVSEVNNNSSVELVLNYQSAQATAFTPAITTDYEPDNPEPM